MNKILITGGSGFLGKALTERLLAGGHRVYSLSRHPPEESSNLVPLRGDILLPGLGIDRAPADIEMVHHLAAIHRLGADPDGAIWETNVQGTINVIEFCRKNKIPRLFFTSTAYTQGRNTYEQSKSYCETLIRNSPLTWTIFKPPIIMGTPQHFYAGHFSQFVSLLLKLHQKADTVRRAVEGALRLPAFERVFHMKANPLGRINLIQIDEVVRAMVEIDTPGTYWLTHPNPPTINEILDWVGESIKLRIIISHDFKPDPVEAMFAKMSKAFTPYLWGDEFPSNIKDCQPITKEFIQSTILMSLFDH